MEEIGIKPTAPATQTEKEEESFSLTDMFQYVRTKWYWYVISIAIAIGLAVLYLMRATPMYTRTTDILIKDDTSQTVGADLSMLGVNPVPSDLLNEMFIMTSPEMMLQVVDRLNLNEVYTKPDGLRKAELYNTSPVMVQTTDSLPSEKGYKFTIDLNDEHTGFTLTDFVQGKMKSDQEIAGTFGKPVQTPVGTFTLFPTKFIKPQSPDAEVPMKVFYSYTPAARSANSYCQQLTSSYDEDRGYIITLSISCASAKKASDILMAIVDAYNQRWVTERNRVALATSDFISERLKAIEAELGEVENSITNYKSSNRMMDLDAMANLYLNQSSENQRTLQALAQDIAIAKFIKSELSTGDITRLLPATANVGETNIQAMVTQYNTMVADRNVKMESLPEESPLMKQKTQAIESLRKAIINSVNTALESLNSRYASIQLVDNQTQSELAAAPGKAKYLMSEERKQKVKESLYVYLLQRREENELNQAFTAFNTRMVTPPFGPDAPTSPRKMMVLLIAIVMGLIVPTLIIYLRQIMDTKVRSRRDIEQLPVPFLGEIPAADVPQHSRFYLGKTTRKNTPVKRQLLVRPHSNDLINEAFRMVRTNIDFMGAMGETRGNGSKVIMVVSLNAGSGKTFISLNTAGIFATKGKKVCLVDMDLRKGTVSHNAGNPPHGVTDFLIGRENDLDKLIVKNIDGIEGYDILPEGIHPPNPTELLYTDRLPLLMSQLRERYDYIVLDCPPVEIVADARILNPYADLTIFVMRAGLFERHDLSAVADLYNRRRYNNLAILLNATDRLHGVYGRYGYGYGQGYYGRGRKRKKNTKE